MFSLFYRCLGVTFSSFIVIEDMFIIYCRWYCIL